jgi:hypothetical protein
VSGYCAAMATQLESGGQAETAATFRMLGVRHAERAKKIAALLPPIGAPSDQRDG